MLQVFAFALTLLIPSTLTNPCTDETGWVVIGDSSYKAVGPMTQGTAVNHCQKECSDFFRPLPSVQHILSELMSLTGTAAAWIDARVRKAKKAKYYRLDNGKGVILENANGMGVKKSDNKRKKCVAYDIVNMKFMKKMCNSKTKAFCKKGLFTSNLCRVRLICNRFLIAPCTMDKLALCKPCMYKPL